MDRSSVSVGVIVAVADGAGVRVGGSNVGGGSNVREGVSEGSGFDGGIVSVGVPALWERIDSTFGGFAVSVQALTSRATIIPMPIRVAGVPL